MPKLLAALNIDEGVNLLAGTTTGSQVGTGATQKVGFYGATPIVQPTNTTDLRQALINLGLYATGGASPLDLNGGALIANTLTASNTGGTSITANASGINAVLQMSGYGTGFFSSVLMRAARGTLATPLRTKSGDVLARFGGTGAYAVDDVTTATMVGGAKARVGFVAAEDWTAGAQGSHLLFETTPTGSNTVAERMRITADGSVVMKGPRPWADLIAHGGDPTGVATSDTALDAAVAALPSTGGVIFVPQGVYNLAATHTFSKEVGFLGVGSASANLDSENFGATALSVFKWSGGAAAMFVYYNASRRLGGFQFRNIALDGNSAATIGLTLDRVVHAHFDTVRIANCVTNCLKLQSTSASANDNTMWNTFSNVDLRSGSGVPLVLDANAGFTSWPCHNTFIRLGVDFSSDPGIDLICADNNLFLNTFTYRRTGSGYAVRFRQRATANYFTHLQPSGGVYAHSTPDAVTNKSTNTIVGYDRSNGQPAPVIEAGARLMWSEDGLNATSGWVLPKLGGTVNVLAWGADPTGAADSTAAIQNALDSLPSRGGRVYCPAGQYKITKPLRIRTTSVATNQAVTLEGDGASAELNDPTNARWLPTTEFLWGGGAVAQGLHAPMIQVGALPAAHAPTATASTTGGTLAAATYYYRILAYDAAGVLIDQLPEVSVVTTGATSSVVLRGYEVFGAASYRVYRGTVTLTQTVYYTTSATSFTDTNAASTGGTPTLLLPMGSVRLERIGLHGNNQATNGILWDRGQFGRIEEIAVTNTSTVGNNVQGTNDTTATIANPTNAPTLATSGTTSTLPAGRYYARYAWQGLTSGYSLPSPESTVLTITAGQGIAVTWSAHPSGGTTALYLTDANGPPGSEYCVLIGATGTTATLTAKPIKATGLHMYTNAGQYDDPQNNIVEGFRASIVPIGLLLSGNIAHSSNTSHNQFRRILLLYGGDGLVIEDADNNSFLGVETNRPVQYAAGYGVVLGSYGGGNFFFHLEPSGGGLLAMAPNTSTSGATVFGYDRANGQVTPVLASYTAAPTATPSGSGGSLASATYYYKIDSYDNTGRQIGRSIESSAAVTGPNGSVALTVYSVTGAVAYRIWRGTATNTQTVYYETTATSYTDTGATALSGTIPTFNSANLSWTEDGQNGTGWWIGNNGLNVQGERLYPGFGTTTIPHLSMGPVGMGQDFVGISLKGRANLTPSNFNFMGTPRSDDLYINRPANATIRIQTGGTDQWRMEGSGRFWGASGAWYGQTGIAGNPGSPTSGDYWYNSTQKAHRFQSDAAPQGLVGLIYASTADDTSATGGTAEIKFTSQIALAAAGLTVGKVIRVRITGSYTTNATASPTAVINIKLGAATNATSGTTVASTRLALTVSLTNAPWSIEADIVIRSATTAWGGGIAMIGSTVALPWTATIMAVMNGGGVNTVTTIPNISTAHTVHATITPSNTGVATTIRTMSIELLN